MYIDQDSLGNDVEIFADNKPNCEECSLAMGLPVTTPMSVQEQLSEIPEKTDKEINIIEATSIKISAEEDIELLPGDSIKLNITAEPAMANIPNVVWESSDISIAYVNYEGIVYAVKKGSVEISATNPENNEISAKINLSVVEQLTPVEPEDVKVSKITLSETSKSLNKKETFTLTATVEPEDATDSTITWSSNNENVTVDSEGLVTAVSTGSSIITATANDGSGVTATCDVTVNPTKVSGISVEPNSKNVSVSDGAFSLTANVTPEDADDKSVTWSSNNEGFATVDPSTGEVTPVSEGEVIITATANDGSGISGTCTVTVTNGVISLKTRKK